MLFLLPNDAVCGQTASDFFKNLSGEKNLLDALYNKNREQNKEDKKIKPFSLSAEAGFLNTSGNTDTTIIKLALEATHELENWSNRYEGQFLSRTSQVTQNDVITKIKSGRTQVSAQFDYKLLEESNRLFAYLEFDDNEFNQLRNQTTVAIGWSQVAWQEEKSDLRYSIGPGYSYVLQESNQLEIEEMILRGSLFYNIKFGENTLFRQVIAAEMGEEISKARAQSSLTAKIFEKLAMKLSVNIVLNDSIATNDNPLSTQTSISMVYQFF